MRSGLFLACGLMLLGGCAQSNWLQSQRNISADSVKTVVQSQKSIPIQLVAYPRRPPQPGLGGRNPWQSNVEDQQDLNLSGTSESQPLERSAQAPPVFENSIPNTGPNSGPQIRRVSRLMTGYSLPPGSDPQFEGSRDGRSLPTTQRGQDFDRSRTADFQQRQNIRQPAEFSRTAQLPPAVAGGIINPPDWNPAATQATPAAQVRSYDSSGRADFVPTMRHSLQSFTQPANIAPRGHSQPIWQAEYQNGQSADSGYEIPLRPGQALPGFVPPARRIQRVSESDQNQERQPLPKLSRNSGPPTAHHQQNSQSPSDALKFLTSTTEREIATLSPGQTTDDLQYYIERHVYLRLLYLMAGQTEWALRPIPNIPAADQEFWTQVLWGVHSYFDLHQVPNPAERAAQTISQFNTAILRLKERAPLEIKNVVFSHKIEGFGEYETYAKDEFAPGQRVLVYAEIGNFHSELTAEGIYRTRLKSALQFYAADSPDELIEDKTYPLTEDFCRNHRRDYFHSYVVDIPARCGKGRHVLKLLIEDELSGKTMEYPVQFNVR
jgi:hypothetical protein